MTPAIEISSSEQGWEGPVYVEDSTVGFAPNSTLGLLSRDEGTIPSFKVSSFFAFQPKGDSICIKIDPS